MCIRDSPLGLLKIRPGIIAKRTACLTLIGRLRQSADSIVITLNEFTLKMCSHLVGPAALICLIVGTAASAAGGDVFESHKAKFQVVTVASGLNHPWSMVFLPSGEILVTERSGTLRLIRSGVLQDLSLIHI